MVDYFKNYWINAFDFKGKATRREYWMTLLSILICGFLLGIIIGIFFPFSYKYNLLTGSLETTGSPIGIFINTLWGIANIIPGLSICVRRLHDIGKSGWYYLMILIPVAGPIIILIYLVTPSVATDTPVQATVAQPAVSEAPVNQAPVNNGKPDLMAPQQPVEPAEPVQPIEPAAPVAQPTDPTQTGNNNPQ